MNTRQNSHSLLKIQTPAKIPQETFQIFPSGYDVILPVGVTYPKMSEIGGPPQKSYIPGVRLGRKAFLQHVHLTALQLQPLQHVLLPALFAHSGCVPSPNSKFAHVVVFRMVTPMQRRFITRPIIICDVIEMNESINRLNIPWCPS